MATDRDSTIATLKIIKDDDDNDNLEAALGVVATHTKKECTSIGILHEHLQRDPRRICTGKKLSFGEQFLFFPLS